MLTEIGVVAGLTALTFYLWKNRPGNSNLSQLPPGPPRMPLVGNLFNMPREKNWLTYLEWKQQYGDLVYAEVLGNKLLIVNTVEAVLDLLELRPTIYSDRPTFTMAGELMGLNDSMHFSQYGEGWKRQRKFAHMALSPEAVKKYESVGDFVAKYADSLVSDPDGFERQLRLTVGRIILSVTYGIPVNTPDDLYIAEAEQTVGMLTEATVPGAFLVDFIPALKYLPGWLPFNHIHKTAASGRAALMDLITRPYEHVKKEREQGTNPPSFTAECLDKFESDDPEVQAAVEHTLLWSAGSLYGGGVETAYSTTLNFILALALYPEVQAKLKEELFRVVGKDRLPTLQDHDSLPYLQATIKEALRWKTTLPLSIARATKMADFYRGYYIPKGTIVLPNVWAISKDDKSGFHPEEFVPERYLADKVKEPAIDPDLFAFGFGRRACPGKYLGSDMLFMLFSHIIATVDISKKKDADGNEIIPSPSYTDGLVSYPRDIDVDIKPTSTEAILIVKHKVAQLS